MKSLNTNILNCQQCKCKTSRQYTGTYDCKSATLSVIKQNETLLFHVVTRCKCKCDSLRFYRTCCACTNRAYLHVFCLSYRLGRFHVVCTERTNAQRTGKTDKNASQTCISAGNISHRFLISSTNHRNMHLNRPWKSLAYKHAHPTTTNSVSHVIRYKNMYIQPIKCNSIPH